MHSAYIVEYICSKTGDTSADKSEYIVAKHIAFYKQIEVHLQHWDEFCVQSPSTKGLIWSLLTHTRS